MDIFKTDLLFTIFSTIVASIVVIKHRANIVRLVKGNENKFSLNKSTVTNDKKENVK
jgi:glycerol-3-phosphate acyltransferase PlsY